MATVRVSNWQSRNRCCLSCTWRCRSASCAVHPRADAGEEVRVDAHATLEVLQPQELVDAVQVLVGHLPGETNSVNAECRFEVLREGEGRADADHQRIAAVRCAKRVPRR